MEFTFDMRYDRNSMTAMAHAMRVGLQEEQDKKSRIIGWIVVVAVALVLGFSGRWGWTQIAAAVLIGCFAVYLIWQDTFNALFALHKLPKTMRTGKWLFREDGYFSDTEAGESDYSYENIFAIVESRGYIFLVFSNGQAQILPLDTIHGGTAAEFRKLLRRKTSLTIQEC